VATTTVEVFGDSEGEKRENNEREKSRYLARSERTKGQTMSYRERKRERMDEIRKYLAR